MAPDKLEGSALEICPMNEAYSWKAFPFNDLGGTTDSNMPESRTIPSLHLEKNATLVMRKIENSRKFWMRNFKFQICIANDEPHWK